MDAATWIFNTLTNDAAISAKVGARIYRDVAPEGTAFPFVVYQQVSKTPVYNAFYDRLMFNERWQVKAVDKGNLYSNIEPVASQIITLLHKKSAAGIFSSTLEFYISLSENDAGETYKTLLTEFRINTE